MQEKTIGKSNLVTRFWMKTRNVKGQIPTDGWIHPAIEFYCPWYAWPLEIMYWTVFGRPKLTAIEGVADGRVRTVNLGQNYDPN